MQHTNSSAYVILYWRMINLMIEPVYFQIVLTSIGIGSTIVVAWLFKYAWKPRPENIFEENLKSTAKIIFQQLSIIDSYKLSIFNYLEGDKSFDMMKCSWHTFPESIFDEMLRLRSWIAGQANLLANIPKTGTYITIDQYLTVQQYAASAYSFLDTISNMEHTISINKKTLEFHRYYAARIIHLFGKSVPKNFRNAWDLEFAKVGGIGFVTKPTIEPGDTISPDYNLHNSLLLYDRTNSEIQGRLENIQKTLDCLLEIMRNLPKPPHR